MASPTPSSYTTGVICRITELIPGISIWFATTPTQLCARKSPQVHNVGENNHLFPSNIKIDNSQNIWDHKITILKQFFFQLRSQLVRFTTIYTDLEDPDIDCYELHYVYNPVYIPFL